MCADSNDISVNYVCVLLYDVGEGSHRAICMYCQHDK